MCGPSVAFAQETRANAPTRRILTTTPRRYFPEVFSCDLNANADGLIYSFDPASLAILDRINHVVTLLESRSTGPSGSLETADAPAVQGENAQGLYPALVDPSPTNLSTSAAETTGELAPNQQEDDLLRPLDIPDFPSETNCCEGILRWPCFRDSVPKVHSFVLETEASAQPHTADRDHRSGSLGRGVQEEDFIPLSKRFLAYVHVKNPILDVKDYCAQVKQAAENGHGWDGPSCLVVCESIFHAPCNVGVILTNLADLLRSRLPGSTFSIRCQY
jgi:hypothetical protein